MSSILTKQPFNDKHILRVQPFWNGIIIHVDVDEVLLSASDNGISHVHFTEDEINRIFIEMSAGKKDGIPTREMGQPNHIDPPETCFIGFDLCKGPEDDVIYFQMYIKCADLRAGSDVFVHRDLLALILTKMLLNSFGAEGMSLMNSTSIATSSDRTCVNLSSQAKSELTTGNVQVILSKDELKPDADGFYSKQLYRWLKKHPRYNQIFERPTEGKHRSCLMIGIKDDTGCFSGAKLAQVCSGDTLPTIYSWALVSQASDEWVNVTELFLERYKKIGVCAIHDDIAHRFVETDTEPKERKCLNCGLVEKQVSEVVIVKKWASVNEPIA